MIDVEIHDNRVIIFDTGCVVYIYAICVIVASEIEITSKGMGEKVVKDIDKTCMIWI